jgi:hypothetical protein
VQKAPKEEDWTSLLFINSSDPARIVFNLLQQEMEAPVSPVGDFEEEVSLMDSESRIETLKCSPYIH